MGQLRVGTQLSDNHLKCHIHLLVYVSVTEVACNSPENPLQCHLNCILNLRLLASFWCA